MTITMNKQLFLFLLAMLLAGTSLFAQNTPQKQDEAKTITFPQWAKDLRRADIIMFGVFPFAWLVSSTIVDLQRSSAQGWSNSNYYPWPATGPNPVPWTNEDYINSIWIASAVALSVVLIDFAIIQIKRSASAARARAYKPDAAVIRRIPMTEDGLPQAEENAEAAAPP
ncbi:MAG: hypothetical protein LBC77_03470 [Spirochaetaceae bacterium]|jgi:hypothetical protein|nr:hypothetical protein [Spirochaetaceae bacterium]